MLYQNFREVVGGTRLRVELQYFRLADIAVAENENRIHRPYRSNTIFRHNVPLGQAQCSSNGYQADVYHIVYQFLGAVGWIIQAQFDPVDDARMLQAVYKGFGIGIANS